MNCSGNKHCSASNGQWFRGDLAMAVKHLQEVISSPSKSQGMSREPTDRSTNKSQRAGVA